MNQQQFDLQQQLLEIRTKQEDVLKELIDTPFLERKIELMAERDKLLAEMLDLHSKLSLAS